MSTNEKENVAQEEFIDVPANLFSNELIGIPQTLSNNSASTTNTSAGSSSRAIGDGNCRPLTECLVGQAGCHDCQNCEGGACETTCEKGCETACEKGCESSCEKGCLGCQDTCQISNQRCFADCQDPCQMACQYCEGDACEIACQNCEGACEDTCQKSCQNCEGACQVGCEVTCQNCQGVSCQTCQNCQGIACQTCQNCQGASCQTCQVGCQVYCQNCQVCQDTCQYGCQNCQGVSCQTCQNCQGASCQTCQNGESGCGICETTCQVLPRPEDWHWVSPVGQGIEVSWFSDKAVWYLTAEEWNQFTARINEFRLYQCFPSAHFTTAVKGEPMLALQGNEAVNAIRDMNPPIAVPNNIEVHDPIEAAFILGLANSLNSIQ